MLSASSHVFSEIFIHLNWHCKDNAPFLAPPVEASIWQWIQNYCTKTKGIKFLGIGGTEDHIHLLIQMEPFVCLSDWVGKVKGASAHEANAAGGRGTVQWQRGYGAVSFAGRDLPALLRYVANQKEHHRRGTVRPKLENHDEIDDGDGSRAQARSEDGEPQPTG